MSQKNQGILCIISAAFFFALMNLFVRLAAAFIKITVFFLLHFFSLNIRQGPRIFTVGGRDVIICRRLRFRAFFLNDKLPGDI